MSETAEIIATLQAENKHLHDEVARLRQQIASLEHALRQHENIIDQIHDSVVATNLDGMVTAWNRGAERLFGYQAHEILGCHISEVYPPDEHAFLYDQVIAPLQQQGSHTVEVRMRHKSGEDFLAHLSLSMLYDQDETEMGMIGYSIDITQHRRAEQEVRQSEERFRTLFTLAPVGIALSNAEGIYMQTNPALHHILGHTEEEMYGRSFTDFTHPDDVAREMVLLREMQAGQRSRYDMEKRYIRNNGQTIWMHVSIAPVLNAAGGIEFFIEVIEDISERKRLEQQLARHTATVQEALQQAETERQRLHTLLMQAPAAICVLRGADHVFISANPLYHAMVGHHRNLQGNRVRDAFPDLQDQQFFDLLDQVYTTGEAFIGNEKHIQWDVSGTGIREDVWLNFVYQPVTNSYGEIEGIFVHAVDVTPQVLARQEVALRNAEIERLNSELETHIVQLQQSQSLLQGLLDNSPISIEISDLDGRYLSVNRYLLQRLHVSDQQDIIGKTPDTFFSPDVCAMARDDRLRILETGKPVEREYTIWLHNERYIILITRFPIYDLTGNIYAIGSIGANITERKQAEEQLKRYAAIIETTSDYIAMADAEGNTLFLNQAGRLLHGFSHDTRVEEMGILRSHPEWALQIIMEQGIPAAIREGVWSGETAVLNHATGEEIPVSQVILIHKSPEGSVDFSSTIMRDITERKRTEAALQQAKEDAEAANRAKSAFLANMSHELRTPLNAILGFTQLMTREANLTIEQQDHLSVISRSGEHLLALINDVLEMSKIEAGRVTLYEQSFDLHLLITSILDMFSLRAADKQLQVRIDRAPDVPRYIYADENKLRQVLMNLLSNAIKFTHQGDIVLSVRLQTSTPSSINNPTAEDFDTFERWNGRMVLCFAVEDTGIGIPPDEIAHLFEAFTQTRNGQQNQEGTGLGLPISRQFVRLMDGEMTVSSTAGQGSVFAFTLPVRLAQAIDIPTPPVLCRVIGLVPDQPVYRILVVEDKWTNRKLLIDLLRPFGFQMREAKNGQEAVALWEGWEPHLIFMDMRMPVMDGYEATRRIKTSLKGQAIAIIALTASAFEEERTVVMSAGCDDFIRKPFRQDDIFHILVKHLGVQFLYAEAESRDHADPAMHHIRNLSRDTTSPHHQHNHEPAFTAAALATLPDEWVAELHQASERFNVSLVVSLIRQIRTRHPDLAGQLASLIDAFRFDEITAITRKMIQAPEPGTRE